jgi:hypothetical protein
VSGNSDDTPGSDFGGRSLADIQHDFAAMLLAPRPPGGRNGIYHNNRRANFRKALALTYPVTARLVGADFFARLADDQLARRPSRHGDLHEAGRDFALCLGDGIGAAGSAFEYLVDLARLEWAWAEALIAADAPVIGLQALRDLDPAAWPHLQLELQPAVAIIESRWPLHSIFVEHRREDPATLSLAAGAEAVAVVRRDGVVEAHRLSPAEGRFWNVLRADGTLLAALDSALEAAPAPDFELGTALGRMFATGAVAGLRAGGAPP